MVKNNKNCECPANPASLRPPGRCGRNRPGTAAKAREENKNNMIFQGSNWLGLGTAAKASEEIKNNMIFQGANWLGLGMENVVAVRTDAGVIS